MNIGKRMWEIAQQQGDDSRSDLARKLGMSESGIYRWFENPPTAPRRTTIEKFCKIYHVTEEDIYGSAADSKSTLSLEEIQLLHAFRQLSQADKDNILRRVLELSFR